VTLKRTQVLLADFHEATVAMSSSSKPTLNLVYFVYKKIMKRLKMKLNAAAKKVEDREAGAVPICKFISRLRDVPVRYKYFQTTGRAFEFSVKAAYLDPRYKSLDFLRTFDEAEGAWKRRRGIWIASIQKVEFISIIPTDSKFFLGN